MLLLLGAFLGVGAETPSQLRVTFSPNPDELIAGWTSFGSSSLALVQSGPSPNKLITHTSGVTTTFANDQCPGNSTRTSHAATFPAPAGADIYYRVSADGATWSPVQAARNPARAYPLRVALWGDLGVECGGVLPPSPGFAGGQCSAVSQLTLDSASAKHDFSIHFGDTAYNMDDRCGNVGDVFLDAASAYSAHRPHVYSNGNHESC
jgi:hypothetical protein